MATVRHCTRSNRHPKRAEISLRRASLHDQKFRVLCINRYNVIFTLSSFAVFQEHFLLRQRTPRSSPENVGHIVRGTASVIVLLRIPKPSAMVAANLKSCRGKSEI